MGSQLRTCGPADRVRDLLRAVDGLLRRLSAAAAAASSLATVGRRAGVALGPLPCTATAKLRLRQLVEVVRAVADRLAFRVEDLERLLERNRRGCVARDGGIEHVEPVLVQVDADVGPRHIRVDDRELLAGDEID